MYEYDNKFMYTTSPRAQELTGIGRCVSGIEMRVPDPDATPTEVARAARGDSSGLPYRTDDWKTMNRRSSRRSSSRSSRWALILLLIVVVAAFNIVCTLVMVVTDKTREIGILKSMGLTSRQVQRVFMLQGLVIGMVGSVLGAVGGLLLIWHRPLPVHPHPRRGLLRRPPSGAPSTSVTSVRSSLLSVVISFVATLYPARQAAPPTPVEAIRHE